MMIAKGSGPMHIPEMPTEHRAATVDPVTMLHLLELDPEGWASLSGMIAILTLPRLRGFESRPRMIEVLIPGSLMRSEIESEWWAISSIVAAHREVAFYEPGLARSWCFPLDRQVYRGIPRWRQFARGIAPTLVEDHHDPLMEQMRKLRKP